MNWLLDFEIKRLKVTVTVWPHMVKQALWEAFSHLSLHSSWDVFQWNMGTHYHYQVQRIRGFAFMRYINPLLIDWLIDSHVCWPCILTCMLVHIQVHSMVITRFTCHCWHFQHHGFQGYCHRQHFPNIDALLSETI